MRPVRNGHRIIFQKRDQDDVKIVLTLLVRDEIDIIRTALDYHFAEGVDFAIVTDNGSVDGTLDVLDEYRRAGKIEIIHEPPSDYSQRVWVTRMARLARSRYAADWVINGDADEFFLWKGGSLREAFDRVPRSTAVFAAGRHDFVPLDRPAHRAVPLEMTHRITGSRNLFNLQPLIPKAIHRGHEHVFVEMGNHRVKAAEFPNQFDLGEIEVYHYPIRTYGQFESKSVNTGSSLERNSELSHQVAKRPRLWYQLWKDGKLEEEYRERIHYSPGRLRAAVETGDIVEDRTLAERLLRHGIA